VHPYFLSAGNHVSVDIPEIVEGYRRSSPHVEFIYTGPLGVSDRIVRLVVDRIREASQAAPSDIERESFRRRAEEGDFSRYPPEFHPVVKRVVHATADFSFIDTLVFHPGAVSAGVAAIRAGKDVLTDVEMVRAGINKAALARLGGRVLCHMGEAQPGGGRTRAEAAMELGLMDAGVGIVAIGNAPTALYKCIEMTNSGRARPDLVVGVPVGFVRAAESKALLAAQAFPFISNAGRRGGTPVAVAIVNALIKIAGGDNG
jgi:precorrin-8X/cobalt-precorrin-8 methylmutase